MTLTEAVQFLRDTFRHYETLSEEEKKKARTELYQKQGFFGKLTVPLIGPFRDKEIEIGQARHDNDQLRG